MAPRERERMKEVVQRRGWCVCRGRGRGVNMERKCRLQKSTDELSVICRTLEAKKKYKLGVKNLHYQLLFIYFFSKSFQSCKKKGKKVNKSSS